MIVSVDLFTRYMFSEVRSERISYYLEYFSQIFGISQALLHTLYPSKWSTCFSCCEGSVSDLCGWCQQQHICILCIQSSGQWVDLFPLFAKGFKWVFRPIPRLLPSANFLCIFLWLYLQQTALHTSILYLFNLGCIYTVNCKVLGMPQINPSHGFLVISPTILLSQQ